MKTTFITLLLTAPVLAQTQIPEIISRPATENQFSEDPNRGDISGYATQGAIFLNPAAAPKGGALHLTEFQIGQPFASYVTPYNGYTDAVLDPILEKLYPTGSTRKQIEEGSGAAFRYKYLIYGTNEGETTVLDFAGQDPADFWFGDDERDSVRDQIAILREAISQDPLNRTLKHTLLDIYYDWAVGEAQYAKQIRSELAKIRLGLELSSDPIIDLEIEAYQKLVQSMQRVIDVYGELLSMEIDGVNPSDFDPSAGGAPLGYYIFKNLVPQRSQIVSKYAPPGGGIASVKDGDETIFNGYKDYRSLLTFLGQRIQFGADLARLQATRNLNNDPIFDMTDARAGLTEAQSQAELAIHLEAMFTDQGGDPIDFDDPIYDDTGVRAAKALISNALGEVNDTRAYLNGTANVLGLDPNFLILVPSSNQINASSNLEDSYDILVDRLIEKNGADPIGPLAIAKKFLGDTTNPGSGGGAIQAYHLFKATVSNIETELSNIETEFQESLERLTGYKPEEFNDFDGINPKPSPAASDLRSANERQSALLSRNAILTQLNTQLLKEATDAQEAVSLAEAIEGKITGAELTYLEDTADAWTEIHAWAGAAAGAAAAYQTFADLSGIDAGSQLVTGFSVGVAVGVAGALNTAIQTTAAVRTSMRQQEIDAAAMNFEVTLATSGLELQVQQAIIQVNSIHRDIISNSLEMLDNNSAIAQTAAEKQAVYREIDIAKRRLNGSVDTLKSSYYADPIFFTRAEDAILKADAAFRNAQRWTFFTCRALEYKWQERFTNDFNGKTYDIGSIFRARNADELEAIRLRMINFNDRDLSAQASKIRTTVISLRDLFVTLNPKNIQLDFDSTIEDDGFRYSPEQGRNLTKVERFRELLKKDHIDQNSGHLVITINTSTLRNLGDFFRGPKINSATQQSGNYRNKIIWTAVHLLSSDGPAVPNVSASKSGALEYGGLTYFRTRIPVYPTTRASAETLSSSLGYDPAKDFPGEFIVAPVRYFQDTALNGRYSLQNEIVDQIGLAESSTSANVQTTLGIIETHHRSGILKERAVAASRIKLEINDSNSIALIDRLEDIEIIIQHESYQRPQVKAPTN